MFRDRSHLILICAIALSAMFAPMLAAAPRQAGGQSLPPASSYTASARTLTGIDVLEKENFAALRGKRVGLITNQTGVDAQGRRTIDVLAEARGVKLVALFSPEHGAMGSVDTSTVEDSTDSATHLPIFSLYGETRRPTPEMLKGIDALVFDVQDAGVRFYTYITTMAYAMEAAAANHIAFFVLDCPDPIGGEVIEGPMLDRERTSFVGYFPMPVRYAMTMGELAQMFNRENKIGADLHVISMKNWSHGETYDQTALRWIPPSPNLRTINEAFLYPGIDILQAGGISVGRGTGRHSKGLVLQGCELNELLAALNSRKIPGVSFSPAQFTPTEDPYRGELCQGVTITLADRTALRSILMGMTIADVLNRLYPQQFHLDKTIFLVGSRATVDRLQHGDDPAQIVAGWASDLDRFRQTRAQYLLYH